MFIYKKKAYSCSVWNECNTFKRHRFLQPALFGLNMILHECQHGSYYRQ